MNALERSWYQKFGWSWLLLPLSLLFWLLSALRRQAFRLGLKTQQRLRVPVVVVGNISVGGTGKTPVTLRLCELLQAHGWRPGIISRGYGVKLRAPRLVQPEDSPAECGDEPVLLARRSGCPVVIYPDRVKGGEFLLSNSVCDVIICDDGLQHYALKRDLEIILIDASRGLGNGLLLPAGPLREGAWRLAQAEIVLTNGVLSQGQPQPDVQQDWRLAGTVSGSFYLQPGEPVPLVRSEAALDRAVPVQLISGIGNPRRFVTTVQNSGFQVAGSVWFADHHPFTADELASMPTPLLMTEKDAVKCQAFAKPGWFYLPVQAVLPADVENFILERLRKTH
ncbi:MAG: tetraacyldisaccharide 4'-kinase [Rheinheimera sp.]|nr:MAG: tetraacyldisaccharide 4'-kinase [Rheinheimera sp.]